MTPDRLAGLRTVELPALGLRAFVAATPRSRLLGLAFLDDLPAGHALLIPRCRSVHTFGMRFALDVVLLDARGAPLETRHAVPPRRIVAHRGASAVLERPAGRSQSERTAPCGRRRR